MTPKTQMQDGGNENTLNHNIYLPSVPYICSSQDILILMFCTSVWQCKVNVGNASVEQQ